MPVLEIADDGARRIWFEGYLDQLVALDLQQLAGFTTREPVRLRQLVQVYAAHSAGTVADTAIASTTCGHATATRSTSWRS